MLMKRRLLVLGAGTAGTMVANKLASKLPEEWEITVVEPSPTHMYQPGLLFVPFGRYEIDDLVRPTRPLLPDTATLIVGEVDRVEPDADEVVMTDGRRIAYDQLVIATGTHPRPDMTPGMDDEKLGVTVHEFFTPKGAAALRDALIDWPGGRLVVHLTELPIKCPVAPLEFAFLADSHFRALGMRDRVDLSYVTPLSEAFTKPVASVALGRMLEERGIALEPDFYVERVDDGVLVSYDEREVPFDLAGHRAPQYGSRLRRPVRVG
jgi:sulfide:quinone oxidoreductase